MSGTRLNRSQLESFVATDEEINSLILAHQNDAEAHTGYFKVSDAANKVNWSDVGAPNGPASLDGTGSLLISQFPLMNTAIQVPATSGTTLIPYDNTVPLITEGTQIASAAFNPSANNSKMIIEGTIQVDCGTAIRTFILALFRDTTCIGAVTLNFITLAKPQILPFCFSDITLGSLFGNTVTYSLRIGVNTAATWYVNRAATAVLGGKQAFNSVLFSEFI